MENYIVSALKYRPTTFDSVIGQRNITDTLRNAIRSNHLAHAYLFCGPRGVGKTTCARIFAKTINCLNPTAEQDACNECESCRAFNEQRSFNIHELDAASNNSVDGIRLLIEQVRIPPQIGKYSVFIIDEVHMLSTGAFNALLKTLEEPPSYAIFILATTEKHKVLPTILSRCQVYDFSRITVSDTIQHLLYVAQKEGINASEEALNVVAQKADGGMRDALSIFDQLVSFCGNTITYERAIEVLNVLDTEYYFRVVDCALQNDMSQVLLLFNNVLQKGFDAQNFVVGLGVHLRNVLVSIDPITTKLLETSDSIRQHYQEQASRCYAKFLLQALSLVNDCDIQYRTAKNKRLTVEIMLLKLCQLTAPATTAEQKAVPLQAPAQAPRAAQPAQQVQPAKPQPQVVQQAPQTPTVIPRTAPTTNAALNPMQMPRISINIGNSTSANQPTASAQTSSPATNANAQKRNTPFSRETFDEVWLTLPRHFANEGRLHAALLNSVARIEGDSKQGENIKVVVRLANEQLQHLVDTEAKQQIVRLLRDQLQNDFITITTEVAEKMQVFTASERLQNLINRNHDVKVLYDTMQLQLD